MDSKGRVVFFAPSGASGIDCQSESDLYVYLTGTFEKGYVNNKGEVVTEPEFVYAEGFSEGLAAVRKVSGKSELFKVSGSTESSKVRLVGTHGFIDTTGKIVIDPQFDFADSFSNGLALISISNRYGFIDKEGKIAINPQFDFADNFSEGLAPVLIEQKMGFINTDGKIVISPQYDPDSDLLAVDILVPGLKLKRYGSVPGENVYSFSGGLAAVKVGEKWGFINKKGEFFITPQFDDTCCFSEGLAAAKVGEKWGFINKEGKFFITPQFDFARRFSEGLAAVKVGEKWGFINKEGKFVFNPQSKPSSRYVDDKGAIKRIYLENVDGTQISVYINSKGEILFKKDRYGKTVD